MQKYYVKRGKYSFDSSSHHRRLVSFGNLSGTLLINYAHCNESPISALKGWWTHAHAHYRPLGHHQDLCGAYFYEGVTHSTNRGVNLKRTLLTIVYLPITKLKFGNDRFYGQIRDLVLIWLSKWRGGGSAHIFCGSQEDNHRFVSVLHFCLCRSLSHISTTFAMKYRKKKRFKYNISFKSRYVNA